MPIYEYQGQQYDISTDDPAAAKAKILKHLGKSEDRPFDAGLGLKSSFAGVGNMVDAAWSGLAGAAATPFSTDQADEIYRGMEERKKSREQWANPDQQRLSFGEQALGTVGTLPMQVAAMPLSAFSTGQEAIDAGESLPAALKATGIDTAGNMAGLALPGMVGKSLIGKMGSGAAINAGQELATKLGIQSQMETEAGKEHFAPTKEGIGIAALIGGSIGGAHGIKSPKAMVKDAETKGANLLKEIEQVKQKPPEAPAGKEIKNLTSLEDANRQQSLWDQDEMVQPGQKYMAEAGDWRIDENGMPVRVDLSLDAQHAQNMLQRDMWVDETPEFAKIQETQKANAEGNWMPAQETKSVASSLDDMGWAHKRGALNKTQLGREMEAPGELEAARIAAETMNPAERNQVPTDMMPGMQEVNAALGKNRLFGGKGGKQRGAIDPQVFREGGRRLTKALSDLTDQPWLAERFPKGEYKTNSDGTPMVLLHGTNEKIDGPLRTDNEQGLHAGNPFASHYFASAPGKRKSVFRSQNTGKNAQLYPMVIKEGNYPFVPKDAGLWNWNSMLRSTREHGPTEAGREVLKHIEEGLAKSGRDPAANKRRLDALLDLKNPDMSEATWKKLLSDAGIDGFFYRNTGESAKSLGFNDAKNRTDRAAREQRINKNLQDGTSFVTYDAANLKSIYGDEKFDHGPEFEVTRDVPKDGGGTEKATVAFKVPFEDTKMPQTKFIPKGQRGHMLIDFNKKNELNQLKKVPGLKESLKDFLPDQATNEQFLAAHKDTPDVDQNTLQKGLNSFTKGGVYQYIKTKNPLIKRGVDRLLDADNRAKALTGEYIHDGLAPLARDLSKQEMTEVWSALKVAEASKTPLTPEMLQRAGYNEKQMQFIETHREVMDMAYEKLKESMEAAGLKPVSKEVAYVAAMSKGNFRKLIYERSADGEPKIVGIIGDNTRIGLNKKLENFLKDKPQYITGEERYFGGVNKIGTDESFMQMLEFLSQNDPKFKEFVQAADATLSSSAYDFMNAKKHTLAKKGIFGMEGNKPWETAETNAVEGLQSQMQYAETMIRWGEMSKAVKDLKPILSEDNGLNMPIAKQYVRDYMKNALGHNPSEVGNAIENLSASFGKSTGVGVTTMSHGFQRMKSLTNGILLGFFNPMFMATNLIQPIKTMPEMAALLRSKGVEGTGSGAGMLGEATMTMYKERLAPGMLSKLEKDALAYARENHVYSSDLFESGNQVRKDASYYWQKGTQIGASQIEQHTRKAAFLSYVHLLDKNGITVKDGLYSAAQRLTDIQMNNYSHMEQPKIYQALGSGGRTAYNLMSYKHNELSRLAMLAREMGDHKALQPVVVNMLAQVAAGGALGVIGFTEADWFVEQVSKLLKKPTSLTKMILENKDLNNLVAYGMGGALGVDLSSRLGTGAIAPELAVTSLMPGSTKLVQAGGAIVDAVKNPNEYNLKNAAREAAPLSLSGPMERAWFSPKDAQGNEMALNRNKVTAGPVRTEADKMWKSVGATGTNEASQKKLAYENQKIDMFWKEKRIAAVKNMSKEFFTSGKFNEKTIQRFIEAQGDPNEFNAIVENIAMEQKVPATKLALIKAAGSNSITAAHRLMRLTGEE